LDEEYRSLSSSLWSYLVCCTTHLIRSAVLKQMCHSVLGSAMYKQLQSLLTDSLEL
jgi:hypothetical protein